MKILKKIYATHCYAAFSRRIDAVVPWITASVRPFCGYDAHKVAWRFRQRYTELTWQWFVHVCTMHFARTRALPANAERIDCNGLRFEKEQSLSISTVFFMRALIEFSLHWLHALAALLTCLRLKPGNTAPMTLVYGVGVESLIVNKSDARFLAYCRHGPITPLTEADTLVIQAILPIESTEPDRVRYHRFPLFAALRWRGLGPTAWSRALTEHGASLVSFFWGILRCPSLVILGRDTAYHAAAAALNRASALRAVVLTNSNNEAQLLWTGELEQRRFSTHMVWYSQNAVPFVYAADPIRSDFPNYRHIRVDDSWVWTEGFAKYLKSVGVPGAIHPVGPILWHLPDARPAATRQAEDIRIAVFDVTPRNDAKLPIGADDNYYSTATMSRFVEDILHARAEIEQSLGRRVRILLKHKRSYGPTHDPNYISLIQKISGPGKPVERVPSDTNMYSFISDCDLTLVIPYSSPALVAVTLQRPAIYYDPTMALLPDYEEHPLLSFVSGRENLVKTLSGFLEVNWCRNRA